MSSAAPTTRTSAIAISATTSSARIRPELVTSRPPSRSPAFRCTRAVAAAGAMPETAAVSERHERGEREDEPVDADLLEPRRRRRGDGDQPLHAPPREEQTGGAAGEREQRAFGQELPHDLAAAGAERGADRDLAPAIGGAREQQAHDVRARDAEHERDGERQDQEHLADVADQILVQRNDRDARPLPLAVLLFELRGDRRHAGLRLRHGDAGLQLRQDAQDDHAARRARRIDPDRAPDVRGDDRRLKSRRHDPGDRRRLPVEENRAADEPGIAVEQPSPQRVADDRRAADRRVDRPPR